MSEMSTIETLLEAAKYVEYRSAAKARGEEPFDYHTFLRLDASGEGRDDAPAQVEQLPQRRQQSLSNSSNTSEEVKEKKRTVGSGNRDPALPHENAGTGTREVHNKLEKNRRAHLKECFEALKKQIPNMDERKTSNLSILRGAIRFIQLLKRKEKEYEHEMERLAREKIAFQQRLSLLKKDIANQMDHFEASSNIPDDDNETTTTASECEGNASDFEDSMPAAPSNANSSSDFTSSSSSSTASSVLVGPVPSTISSASSFALPKQISTGAQSSASIKEPPSNLNQYSSEMITVANKTQMATSVPSAVTAHPMNNSENTAQTARVFSAGNIHAIPGIFPHTMQVITQPSGIKVITTPNSIMASNSSVQHLSVNHQQHGQIHVLAPSSNTSYASSITATTKPFSTDSLVQVASSTTKSISKPHLVSPLALVSPQTMVGISHSNAGKSLNNSAAISDLIPSQGTSGTLNLSQSAVKGSSVLPGNMTIAVKNNLPNSATTCASSHSNMVATLHVSKAHSQVIQPSLASNIISQGGTQVNNTHHGVASNLKQITSAPVRSLPHIAGVAHVTHVVSQSPVSGPVGQIVTPGNHVSAVTPLVGSVSVVSHPGAVHQQSIGKVIASPVLKSVNQINSIPILQPQFLQQVSVGSSNQPIVKPVVVVSMSNVVSSSNMSNLTHTSLVTMNEQSSSVRGSATQK